jgi:hypothetical protein
MLTFFVEGNGSDFPLLFQATNHAPRCKSDPVEVDQEVAAVKILMSL